MHDYLPKKPLRLPFRQVPSHLWNLFSDNWEVLKRLFFCYDKHPGPPDTELPSNQEGELSKEQRQQCKEIFEATRDRFTSLESRASSLIQTVVILVPLALASWAFLWKNSVALSPLLLTCLVVFSLLSLLSSLGAVVAALRAGTILPLQTPGPEWLFDSQEGARREYEAERDGYCLIWCAWMNHALADHRYDFIRAGQVLVSLALAFLLLAGMLLASVSSTVFSRKQASDALPELQFIVKQQEEQLRTLQVRVGENTAELERCRSNLALLLAQQEPEPSVVPKVEPPPNASSP